MEESIEFVAKTAMLSNEFERNNSELKKQYIISNIILYNTIASIFDECTGTFGTGYPFYILNNKLEGSLPIIDEQIRYNNELIENAKNSSFDKWLCAQCLDENYITMPDLKQICKTCPGMENALKPRELIKRLPDLDMWMVCSDDNILKVAENFKNALYTCGFKTSDIDPVKTIYDMQEIVTSLRNNKMPKQKLPIDTHIIDNISLYTLISRIPDILDYCYKKDTIPYLPIHPYSLRKNWQKDDAAYNFVHDYLSSFTEFEMDPKIQAILNGTRQYIAKKYSLDQLYKFLLETWPVFVANRHKTPGIKESFEKRIESWREM